MDTTFSRFEPSAWSDRGILVRQRSRLRRAIKRAAAPVVAAVVLAVSAPCVASALPSTMATSGVIAGAGHVERRVNEDIVDPSIWGKVIQLLRAGQSTEEDTSDDDIEPLV